MRRRISLLAAAAALTIGAGVLPTSSSSAIARDWRLIVNDGPAQPVKSAGTACTSFGASAQSAWRTILACVPYISRTGTIKMHYSYARYDLNSGDICLTNGYLANSSGLRYDPSVCSHITLGGPRVPLSSLT